ncbi:MAG: HlyD family efflux transporter periplasmic adaptor subunit [Lachnospiraceae bacterium]
MPKNKKIIKYKKPFNINIGMVIFGFIFIYIMVCVVHYITQEHVTACEVQAGNIAQNNSYTGFAIREETVVLSGEDGYINYFPQDKTKVSPKSLIYSLDSTGDFFETRIQSKQAENLNSVYATQKIKDALEQFSYSYSGSTFYNTYMFKDDLKAKILEALTLDEDGTFNGKFLNENGAADFKTYYPKEPGIILYSVDEMEDVTLDNFQPSMMNESSYNKINLKIKKKVQKNEAVYKLVTNENWQLVVPVSKQEVKQLQDETFLKITFRKDGKSAWAGTTLKEINGSDYLILSFNNGMIRYADERFLSIKFTVDPIDGLKIPNTAIVKEEFLRVPVEYATKGGNSSESGFLKQTVDKKGKISVQFVKASIYCAQDDFYYIRSDELKKGDSLIQPESNRSYKITTTKELSGVFNINKGYAVFKQINILFSNEDYSIIEKGTDYGIGIYDHIALDGSIVKEGDIVDE